MSCFVVAAVVAVVAIAVAVAVAAVAAPNRLESREGGWPATRVEGNIGRSIFGSPHRLFVIGFGGSFRSEVYGCYSVLGPRVRLTYGLYQARGGVVLNAQDMVACAAYVEL